MVRTGAERSKDWRKENPDKIKAYLDRNKERIIRFRREYRIKNLDHIRKIQKEYEQKVGYAYDKSGKRKELALIRSKTRSKYPLKGKDCEICNNVKAQQRHHTTIPPEVDKFIFLCNNCHDDLHGRKRLVSGENPINNDTNKENDKGRK